MRSDLGERKDGITAFDIGNQKIERGGRTNRKELEKIERVLVAIAIA